MNLTAIRNITAKAVLTAALPLAAMALPSAGLQAADLPAVDRGHTSVHFDV